MWMSSHTSGPKSRRECWLAHWGRDCESSAPLVAADLRQYLDFWEVGSRAARAFRFGVVKGSS